jgi:putative transport protein
MAKGCRRVAAVPEFLLDDTIALVLLVMGVSAAIGSVRFGGVTLGPAAALFVGLLVGALDDTIAGDGGLAVLREFGLVLFTYTVGVASGPNFVAGFRRGGARAVAVTIGLVAALAAMCALVAGLLDLSDADRAGLFAGSTTNTPSLQAAVDATTDGDPVIAYSLAYPAAIASMLVVVTVLLGRRLHVPARFTPPPAPPPVEHLVNWTVIVDQAGVPDLGELRRRYPRLNFSRIEHDGAVSIATLDRVPSPGDALVVVGPDEVVEQFCRDVGHRSDRHLPLDRATFDFRRILVSDRRLAGSRLGDLDLLGRFGVTVTRLRRGDDDLLARDDMELQLGDRLRVVGPSEGLAQVARTVGDSEKGLSELDAVGFALGIAAGLLLGMVAMPLFAGVEVELGAGGGPLVAGLVLGALARTGPVTWQMPRATNLILRQIGILMFLACAGLASGATFADAVTTRTGLELLVAGGAIAATFAALIAVVAQIAMRQSPGATAGTFAGIETQPAALAHAADRTSGDERVNAAYALVFPVAMIVKIIAVQFLV